MSPSTDGRDGAGDAPADAKLDGEKLGTSATEGLGMGAAEGRSATPATMTMAATAASSSHAGSRRGWPADGGAISGVVIAGQSTVPSSRTQGRG